MKLGAASSKFIFEYDWNSELSPEDTKELTDVLTLMWKGKKRSQVEIKTVPTLLSIISIEYLISTREIEYAYKSVADTEE